MAADVEQLKKTNETLFFLGIGRHKKLKVFFCVLETVSVNLIGSQRQIGEVPQDFRQRAGAAPADDQS